MNADWLQHIDIGVQCMDHVQHQLGEATCYQERMDEFLAVAKSLEIKEICNAGPEPNDEPDNESSVCD